jgi:hypothetical protein
MPTNEARIDRSWEMSAERSEAQQTRALAKRRSFDTRSRRFEAQLR